MEERKIQNGKEVRTEEKIRRNKNKGKGQMGVYEHGKQEEWLNEGNNIYTMGNGMNSETELLFSTRLFFPCLSKPGIVSKIYFPTFLDRETSLWVIFQVKGVCNVFLIWFVWMPRG